MPTTALSLRYTPRLSLHWQPLSWDLIIAGLPLLPPPLLFTSISVFPVYTSSVLLLDTATATPGVSNTVLAAGLTLGMAVFWWLFNRSIAANDATNKETKDAVQTLTALVTEMRLERKEDSQLTKYLKERQGALEEENKSLHKSVNAFDTYLTVQAANHKPANY
ncbi:hypothetical protein DNI29_19190 [Hymenobacter sediminis]|uniref:hypothetical protein n=1 Tax=Hymenobacter sediminis TaxID=2218621 RepID=UPI000F503891|nr:hypothetical protein [Hymenobacter sediminis]RPD44835.1 hypothetical protein DNI29_19190 [Hymenobacter sediminis]